MQQGLEPLIMVAAMAGAALVAFVVYKWRQRARARLVRAWVTGYLSDHYGSPLDRVRIDCSDDHLWPVLVDFADPRNGSKHRLRFSCAGAPSTFHLTEAA